MRTRAFLISALSLCGLGSMPAGAAVSPAELVKPIAAYKTYVTGEVNSLVDRTRVFVDDIKKGDLAKAQDDYAPTHQHYERIEPIAELFNDLDGSMDAREDDYEKKADDPKFTGFHRIEKGLFADKSLKDLEPLADRLLVDTLDLQKRLADLVITPKAMVGGSAELIEEVASKKISGEEDRYSRTDLWDFQANVDGAQKILVLLNPLIRKQDPALDTRLHGNLAKVDAVLARYRVKDGFASYEKLTDDDRTRLKGPVTALAEDFSTMKGKLGVE